MLVFYNGTQVVGTSSLSNSTAEKENAKKNENCIHVDEELLYPHQCYVIIEGRVELKSDWEDIKQAVEQEITFGPQTLDAARSLKKVELEQAREQAFETGVEVELDGNIENIQARPLDKTNVLAQRVEAKEMISEGVSGTLPIRTRSNQVYHVTPEQMVVIADAVNVYAKEVYAKSWALKDQLAGATTQEEINQIQW